MSFNKVIVESIHPLLPFVVHSSGHQERDPQSFNPDLITYRISHEKGHKCRGKWACATASQKNGGVIHKYIF